MNLTEDFQNYCLIFKMHTKGIEVIAQWLGTCLASTIS